MNSVLSLPIRPAIAVAPQSQLARATLARVPATVRKPAFDVAALRPGILHLGCGSFHRAHQASLTQTAIEEELRVSRQLPSWGIAAASLRTSPVTHKLARQDGLYTVLEHEGGRINARVIGTLCESFFHPAQPLRLRRAFADPAIRIVTLTITSGGYCIDPANGDASVAHQAAKGPWDAEAPTAIGVVVEGLRLRREAGMAPPVILSCDNLPANGRLLRRLCIDFAARSDNQLSNWIAGQVQFPSTMVDRIVPAASARDLADARAVLGLHDAVPVPTEPFSQWVIENFDGPRPCWEAAGAEYVADVGPWEASKLRLLNGGHLAIACLGRLANCETVAQVMDLPGFGAYVHRLLVEEQKPTLPPSDHDIDAYAGQLLRRFRNHGIAHRLDRITRDSPDKLAARLLDPLRENLRAGRAAPCTILAVAAWMRCVSGVGPAPAPQTALDPQAMQLRRCGSQAGEDPDRLVDLLLAVEAVFGSELPRDAVLRRALCGAMRVLQRKGARTAIANCAADAWAEFEAAPAQGA